VQRFVQGGEWSGELALRRKDGRLVDVEAKATAIFLPVGPIFVAVLRDVTERKAADIRFRELLEQSQQIQEELRLANESKDEFLGLVSHELRTPITTIFGGARLLRTRGERLDEQSKAEVLEDIERESERLHRIVEDLLVLARIELGQEITTEPVLIRRVVERAISTFSKRRPGRPIEIQTDSRPAAVRASSVYLDQILRNLINNADKYSPTGQPIDIWVRREGDELVVSVLDRGPGISSEEMDLIFERFYRSGRTAGQASGAGIGLTVCKRLIEVQGGRIWASEREGGGLAISFALPIGDES
jgi:two-component system sensor histidine kinase KdpD